MDFMFQTWVSSIGGGYGWKREKPNLEAPQPLESQAYLITAILDNSAEIVPKNWEWVNVTFGRRFACIILVPFIVRATNKYH